MIAILVAVTVLGNHGAPSATAATTGWLNWRGSHQTGVSDDTGLPDRLEVNGANQLWTLDIAGRGEATVDLVRSRLLLEFARPDQVAPEIRAEFLSAYAECCRDTGYANTQASAQWLLPVAVARLAEPVGDAERRNLGDLVARMTASSAGQSAAA